MKVAIIGYGYWGPNLVRNFYHLNGCVVSWICDTHKARLQLAKRSYPTIQTTSNLSLVLEDKTVDAVVIATPVSSHFSIAKKALEYGKHILLEKPLTSTSKEAEILVKLAQRYQKILMVDHIYIYHPAITAIKKQIDNQQIGKLNYIDSTRINLGLFQNDINVLWDLGPHDISICNYLMETLPYAVQAVGVSHTKNGLENMAYLSLFYPENRMAHVHLSWVSPVKIRQMLIGGDKKMIVFNDLETTEKVKIYDTGYKILPDEERNRLLVDYRVGDIFIPKIEQKEALAFLAEDFFEAVMNGKKPEIDGEDGWKILKILEAAQLSMKHRGEYTYLDTSNI